ARGSASIAIERSAAWQGVRLRSRSSAVRLGKGCLHELIGMSELHAEMLGPYLPQFRYVLDDLSKRSDEELMARALGALGLLALLLMRHGRDKRDLLQRLVEWAALFRSVWQAKDGREALGTLPCGAPSLQTSDDR
ncbi:MAG: Rpn family recombination-promoting nuclease/putative transposase, partial [Polyangiaceae bacterium]|nr:Rpn family recombination-promoting nuclease/putative transposase [Polyangiaceae bacterium]